MKGKKQNVKSQTTVSKARARTAPDAATLPVGEIVIERPDDVTVVQLREEELGVTKQWAEAGAVLIRKKVETRTDTLPVELGYEEVSVQRVPVNRMLAEGESAEPRQEGDTLIVPVVEEEIVITKRSVVREELHVTKRRLTRQREVTGEVRREHLDVETTGKLEALQDRTSTQA
ncbi:MAG: YsnF/AvaK domain-containing protein [Chloroflexia bacterium]